MLKTQLPAGVSNEVLARTRAQALTMPLWELSVRAALEVGVILLVWQVAGSIIKGLSKKGQQVRRSA